MGANLDLPQPLVLHFGAYMQRMSATDFFEFCRLNSELRIERTSEGDLIIIAPTGSVTGQRNFALAGMFAAWVETDRTGIGFDSSTGFTLPNGAVRSPDLAWVRRSRWDALTPTEQGAFAPLCPDFVVELRSPSDTLEALQAKMREYIANGTQLGWLIDADEKRVEVYRPGAAVERLDDPRALAGDPVLPGFVLEVSRLWPPSSPN